MCFKLYESVISDLVSFNFTDRCRRRCFIPHLGGLDNGSLSSNAIAVSDDGLVVIGSGTDASGKSRPFRWDAVSGITQIQPADGSIVSSVSDISGDGTTIVGIGKPQSNGIRSEAILLNSGGSVSWLGHLPDTSSNLVSRAIAVSGDGSVVIGFSGHYQVSSWLMGLQGFRWDVNNGMQGLGDLAGGVIESAAYDVSDTDFIIVGYSVSELGREAFRWESSTGMTGLGDLTQSSNSLFAVLLDEVVDPSIGRGSVLATAPYIHLSTAYAISGDGTVIVGQARSNIGSEAFLWDSINGMVGLGDIQEPPSSVAYDVSGDGAIIVGKGRGNVALIWARENNYEPVSLGDFLDSNNIEHPEFSHSTANAVSTDGTVIVGQVEYPNSDKEAFVLYLDAPEPAFWGNYMFTDKLGNLNTGDWLGWVNARFSPYIWSYSLEGWMYMEEPEPGSHGSWAYIFQ